MAEKMKDAPDAEAEVPPQLKDIIGQIEQGMQALEQAPTAEQKMALAKKLLDFLAQLESQMPPEVFQQFFGKYKERIEEIVGQLEG